MKKTYFIYLIIVGNIVLLIYNISKVDYGNLQEIPFSIISNVILVIAMIITMLFIMKNKKNKQDN